MKGSKLFGRSVSVNQQVTQALSSTTVISPFPSKLLYLLSHQMLKNVGKWRKVDIRDASHKVSSVVIFLHCRNEICSYLPERTCKTLAVISSILGSIPKIETWNF